MADEVDESPIEERIAKVRALEEAGELPSGHQEKTWKCYDPECDFESADPQEIMTHQGIHPPADYLPPPRKEGSWQQ